MESASNTALATPPSDSLLLSLANNPLLNKNINKGLGLIHFRPHLEVSDVIPGERITAKELDKRIKDQQIFSEKDRPYLPETLGTDIELGNQNLAQAEMGTEPVNLLLMEAVELIDREIMAAEAQMQVEDSLSDELELQDSRVRLGALREEVERFRHLIGRVALGSALVMASHLLSKTRRVSAHNEAVISQAISHSTVDVIGFALAGGIIPFTGDEPSMTAPPDPVTARLMRYRKDMLMITASVLTGQPLESFEQYISEVGGLFLEDARKQNPLLTQEEAIEEATKNAYRHYQEMMGALEAVRNGEMTLNDILQIFFNNPADELLTGKKANQPSTPQYSATSVQRVAQATEMRKLMQEGEKVAATRQASRMMNFLNEPLAATLVKHSEEMKGAMRHDAIAQAQAGILAGPGTALQQAMDMLKSKLDGIAHSRGQSMTLSAD